LKEVETDPSVMWIAIVAQTVIVPVTVTVSIHVEILPDAVLLPETVRVLEMHLRHVGMSVMADVEGAIADLHLVPQKEEVRETEAAVQELVTGGETVIEMTEMTEMIETIYETSEIMAMTLVPWPTQTAPLTNLDKYDDKDLVED
jgi:hypothetical protein